MEHSRHARIDELSARRLGELTKREIQVLIYLKLCRNARTGRCNPGRSAIAAFCRLARPHVTIAIAGLETKGWIVEDADGFKITESVTIADADRPGKVTKSVTGKVTESVTVTESVITKSVSGVTDLARKVTELVIPLNIIQQTKQTKNKKNTPDEASDEMSVTKKAEKVFQYWKTICGKGDRTTFTDKRKKAVINRLKKYSVKDIFDAIDGCKRSPHHVGLNDTGTVYDDLELICRSDTHVERFIEYGERAPVRKATADPGRPTGTDPKCVCRGSGWSDVFPEGVDRERYGNDRFPCPECSRESYEFCLNEYAKRAA